MFLFSYDVKKLTVLKDSPHINKSNAHSNAIRFISVHFCFVSTSLNALMKVLQSIYLT